MPEFAYLRFINMLSAIRSILPSLDTSEERLLNMVMLAWQQNNTVTVTQAMANTPDLSPATVHRKIQTLVSKERRIIRSDAEDARYKYLEPTRQAIDYFEKLSICMRQASAE